MCCAFMGGLKLEREEMRATSKDEWDLELSFTFPQEDTYGGESVSSNLRLDHFCKIRRSNMRLMFFLFGFFHTEAEAEAMMS